MLKRPAEYLVRIGETSKDFAALSDPPLSAMGMLQAQAVVEFLGFEGIGRIEIPSHAIAAIQFAHIILDSDLERGPEFPAIKIMDSNISYEVSAVGPGGIVAVYVNEDGQPEFVPRLNVLPVGELN